MPPSTAHVGVLPHPSPGGVTGGGARPSPGGVTGGGARAVDEESRGCSDGARSPASALEEEAKASAAAEHATAQALPSPCMPTGAARRASAVGMSTSSRPCSRAWRVRTAAVSAGDSLDLAGESSPFEAASVDCSASRSSRRIAPAMVELPTTARLGLPLPRALPLDPWRGVVRREELGEVSADVDDGSVVPASTRSRIRDGRLDARRCEPRPTVRWLLCGVVLLRKKGLLALLGVTGIGVAGGGVEVEEVVAAACAAMAAKTSSPVAAAAAAAAARPAGAGFGLRALRAVEQRLLLLLRALRRPLRCCCCGRRSDDDDDDAGLRLDSKREGDSGRRMGNLRGPINGAHGSASSAAGPGPLRGSRRRVAGDTGGSVGENCASDLKLPMPSSMRSASENCGLADAGASGGGVARAVATAALPCGGNMVGPSVNKLGRVKKAKMLDCMYKLYREEPCELCPSKYRQPSTSFSSFSAPSVLPCPEIPPSRLVLSYELHDRSTDSRL